MNKKSRTKKKNAPACCNCASPATHPRQPIVLDRHGTARFKENRIIRWMLDMGREGRRFDLNDITVGHFADEDLVQLCQLIGYSITGFGELSFIPEGEVAECDKLAEALLAESKK